jgi:hypothetical protein
VFAFFRKTHIVDDLSGNGMASGHLREDVLADGLEEQLVVPGRYRDDMVRGLVSALDTVWAGRVLVKTGGHGFHAFAISGQDKAKAVAGQVLMPVSASCRLRQALKMGGNTLLA